MAQDISIVSAIGMDTEFKLTREEYVEFIKLAYSRMSRLGGGSKKFIFINIIVWIFIGMGFAGIFRFYEVYEGLDFKHLNIALTFWVIGILGIIAASIYQRKFYLHHSLSEDGRMLKDQKVTLSDDAITFSTVDCNQSYSWSSIRDCEYSENLICLYIDNNQALLIPKRAIGEETKLQELIDFINIKACSDKHINEDISR